MGKFLLLMVVAISLYFTYSLANNTSNGAASTEVLRNQQAEVIVMENLKSGREVVHGRVMNDFITIPATSFDQSGGTVTYWSNDTLGSHKVMHVRSTYDDLTRSWSGVIQRVAAAEIDSPTMYLNANGSIDFDAQGGGSCNNNTGGPNGGGNHSGGGWTIRGNSDVHAMGVNNHDRFNDLISDIAHNQRCSISGVSASNDIVVADMSEMYNDAYTWFMANPSTVVSNQEQLDVANLGTREDPQIVVVNGDAELTSHMEGYGVLVINGNVEMSGNFEWHGLVIVHQTGSGSISTASGTPSIYGRFWVHSESGQLSIDINGNPEMTVEDDGFLNDLLGDPEYSGNWMPAQYVDVDSYYHVTN